MSKWFGHLKMQEVKQSAEADTLILLPVGMYEEHGPHMPVSTDTMIAQFAAKQLAERLDIETLVLPAMWTGYHGGVVADFPGGIKLSPETLLSVMYEMLMGLANNGFTKIMIINAHGQNPAIIKIAIRKVMDETGVTPILTYPMAMIGKQQANAIRQSAQGGIGGHAGEMETSLILAIDETLIDMSKAPDESCTYRSKFVAGDLFPEHDVIGGAYWSMFATQTTKTGVLGNASTATKQTGQKLWDIILQNHEELAIEYYNH